MTRPKVTSVHLITMITLLHSLVTNIYRLHSAPHDSSYYVINFSSLLNNFYGTLIMFFCFCFWCIQNSVVRNVTVWKLWAAENSRIMYKIMLRQGIHLRNTLHFALLSNIDTFFNGQLDRLRLLHCSAVVAISKRLKECYRLLKVKEDCEDHELRVRN